MKVTWITQAGLVFEADGKKIVVDPYLSDSCSKVNPKSKRRIPVDEKFLNQEYDVVIFTHDHMDHTDPETYPVILNKENHKTVLCPFSSWSVVRQLKGNNNFVMFNAGTTWTEGNIKFKAIKAEHSDREAIGVAIYFEDKIYYVTGDTLYNREVVESAPEGADYMFVPVNGVGNNMNMTDAADFAEAVDCDRVVPLHVGLFDDLKPEDFKSDRRFIMEVYKEYEL